MGLLYHSDYNHKSLPFSPDSVVLQFIFHLYGPIFFYGNIYNIMFNVLVAFLLEKDGESIEQSFLKEEF